MEFKAFDSISRINKLEPRILIENTDLAFGDELTENILIHGDNLLALKALETEFSRKFKCIYIDPPYNTGSRINSDGSEVGYDDGLEHSEWLNMMKPRLELLGNLLHEDGLLAIQIDDNEYARLYMLMAELFGDKNLKTIVVKMSEPTGLKMAHVSKSGIIPKLKEYIIFMKRNGVNNLNIERVPKDNWDNEYKTLIEGLTEEEILKIKSIRDDESRSDEDVVIVDNILAKMNFKSLSDVYREQNISSAKDKESFNFENAWRIVQIASIAGGAKNLADEKRKELSTITSAYSITTVQRKMYFIKNDYSLEVSTPRIKLLFADDYLTVHPGDFWQDIKTTGLDNEGGVDFKNGKKPEQLIKRIIKSCTVKGDWVLDSFAGSGTTPCVALKMGRKFVAIEIGPHCLTHTYKRLTNVISGADIGKVGMEYEFSGGGGFRYMELASSLLQKDDRGNSRASIPISLYTRGY